LGCGTLDWADLFDHALGILAEEDDARVREHLASCEACRADGGALAILSGRLKSLGELTTLRGREAFAERTRSDARAAMGVPERPTRTSAAWRVAALTDSQRIRREAARRRAGLLRRLFLVGGSATALACALGLAYTLGFVDYAVDRWGAPVERALGVDLASWGLRPTPGGVAASARAASSRAELSALAPAIERLLRRELAPAVCRTEAAALLGFALVLAREAEPRRAEEQSDVRDLAELLASAVEAAGRASRENDPLTGEELECIRRARGLAEAGDRQGALAALDLLVTGRKTLGLYFAAQVAAQDPKGAERADKLFAAAAERAPVVWVELAWRRLRAGSHPASREALLRAPPGAFREAAERFFSRAGLR